MYFIRNCFFVFIFLYFAFYLFLQHNINIHAAGGGGFEPATPARDQPHTLSLDRSATPVK
jgi:hypothetical protein